MQRKCNFPVYPMKNSIYQGIQKKYRCTSFWKSQKRLQQEGGGGGGGGVYRDMLRRGQSPQFFLFFCIKHANMFLVRVNIV